MAEWLKTFCTFLAAVLASSGFWAFLQSRRDKKDAKTRLLVGLAHDRICWLGMSYVKRGYITQDEFENLHDYLYVPYHELGGNGSAERVMKEVEKLELRDN